MFLYIFRSKYSTEYKYSHFLIFFLWLFCSNSLYSFIDIFVPPFHSPRESQLHPCLYHQTFSHKLDSLLCWVTTMLQQCWQCYIFRVIVIIRKKSSVDRNKFGAILKIPTYCFLKTVTQKWLYK